MSVEISGDQQNRQLEDFMRATERPIPAWSPPTHFDFAYDADRNEATRRYASGEIRSTINPIDQIAQDMFEMRHPDLVDDSAQRAAYVADVYNQGRAYGSWFQFDWSKTLQRFPEQDDFEALRTYRNQPLNSPQEQRVLQSTTVEVHGLSVGSNIVEQLVQSGVGGTISMHDFDTLSLTNLNRIKATMAQVGMRKVDIAACKVSEVDPYLSQVHSALPTTQASLNNPNKLRPDIIFDAVDDLSAKALLRIYAAKHKVPLVMVSDVGDTSIVDVERYDIKPVAPFNGRLNNNDLNAILADKLTPQERQKMIIKIIGLRNITPRLLQAAGQIEKTIGGLPQLGTTAAAGGTLGAIAAREILLGRRLESGRYRSSPAKSLRLQSATSPLESIAIVGGFVRDRLQE